MITCYETRAVDKDDLGTGEAMEHYPTLEQALLDSLEFWPEDERSDVLIYVMTGENTDLAATIRHHHPDDPGIATVGVFTTTGKPDILLSEFHCEYVEVFGRVHTNITRVQD